MNAHILITPVQPEEVGAIAELAREIWQAAYLELIGQAQIDYMLAQRYSAAHMQQELQRPDIWWQQLHLAGERVGFSSCHLLEHDGEREMKLDKLYVHPAHQRHGLGGRLIAHACDLARSQQCRALILAVNKGNAPALAAYHRHGFQVRESVKVDIGGGFVMDDFVMAKSLA